MGPAGLYLLRRPEWWISPLFRLVGMLYSVNIYLRFYSKTFGSYYTFYQQTPYNDTIIQKFSYSSIRYQKSVALISPIHEIIQIFPVLNRRVLEAYFV